MLSNVYIVVYILYLTSLYDMMWHIDCQLFLLLHIDDEYSR